MLLTRRRACLSSGAHRQYPVFLFSLLRSFGADRQSGPPPLSRNLTVSAWRALFRSAARWRNVFTLHPSQLSPRRGAVTASAGMQAGGK